MSFNTATAFLALPALVMALGIPLAQAGGAIVSSPVKGKYYYMTRRPTGAYAAQLALADCESHFGGGCRVLIAYESGCVAIAHGGGHSGWAVKISGGAAQADALGQCEKYGIPCHLDVNKCE